MSDATAQLNQVVAAAAVARSVLLGRAAVTMTATAVGLRLRADPYPQLTALALVAVVTAVALAVLNHDPHVVRHPLPILALDFAAALGLLAVGHGDVAYFCYAVGACALGGVLTGPWALLPAAPHAAVGYLAAADVLDAADASVRLAGFVLAFPTAGLLAAAGAAAITTGVARHLRLSVELVAAAQRSAAASERARLARELHDSVAATLRGVSFAAVALPSSLRRHPALAQRLADTVSQGASAAVAQARDLLDGLRLDRPDEEFAGVIDGMCRQWSKDCGVPVVVRADHADPPVAVRYELCRILQEALRNTAQHAKADQVDVVMGAAGGQLRMRISDDGDGFRMPADAAELREDGHLGVVGMIERARLLGGTLRLASRPGSGTVIDVAVPLPVGTAP
ncbi:signal transduction histidine kinase [Allocatelliglobosispora scoriae]|uniref:Signal transduction histidine kinase n=1 Tax=Allocatelliglobosispora scoriae TaxID=643052 RepID=A0A841C1J0_9ACTN|nr:histidine kinase [Allocatelliglobosispora scoriae]MBB5874224.1 signal transduction histidine kinase [Allocatelliglobosispora scoriae]